MTSVLLQPYTRQVYEHLLPLYDEERLGSFSDFSRMYTSKYLGKTFSVPVTQDVMLRVRINPTSSAHTNVSVDVSQPNWYGALCASLKAKDLVACGKPLTEWPVQQLERINSVRAVYGDKAVLAATTSSRLPIDAPLAYSPHKSAQVRSWFSDALAHVGRMIGEHLAANMPSAIDSSVDPDELAAHQLTQFVSSKTAFRSFVSTALDTLPNIGQARVNMSPELKQRVMQYLYTITGNVAVNHMPTVRTAFLRAAVASVSSAYSIDAAMMASAASVAAPVGAAAATVNVRAGFDEDLFGNSARPVSDALSAVAPVQANIFTRALNKVKDWTAKVTMSHDAQAKRLVQELVKVRGGDDKKDKKREQDILKQLKAISSKDAVHERMVNDLLGAEGLLASKDWSSVYTLSGDTKASVAVVAVDPAAVIAQLFVREANSMKNGPITALKLVAEIACGACGVAPAPAPVAEVMDVDLPALEPIAMPFGAGKDGSKKKKQQQQQQRSEPGEETKRMPELEAIKTAAPKRTPVEYPSAVPNKIKDKDSLPELVDMAVTVPMPALEAIGKPMPVLTPIAAPMPALEAIGKPMPALEAIGKPMPVLTPIAAPMPALEAIGKPMPALTPIAALMPALTPIAAPMPALTPIAAPMPALEAIGKPMPVLTPIAAPMPALVPIVAPVAAPMPALTPIAAPMPALVPVAPVTAPMPALVPIAAPMPALTPIAAPMPALTPIAAPMPALKPIAAPMPPLVAISTSKIAMPLPALTPLKEDTKADNDKLPPLDESDDDDNDESATVPAGSSSRDIADDDAEILTSAEIINQIGVTHRRIMQYVFGAVDTFEAKAYSLVSDRMLGDSPTLAVIRNSLEFGRTHPTGRLVSVFRLDTEEADRRILPAVFYVFE